MTKEIKHKIVLVNKTTFLLTFCVFIISSFFSMVNAQGSLLVTPKRVVFDGNKRSEELNLANTGKDSATYIISFIQIKMKDDGTFEQMENPDSTLQIASNNLRFFPRSVTLAPNEAQSVRVQVRNLSELNDGEYRSHIYFKGLPNQKALGEEGDNKDSSISVKITPVYGLSLPVIIRKGALLLKANITDFEVDLLKKDEPYVKFVINREGNMSTYGDISVNYIANNEIVTNLALIKGLAVYTPNKLRKIVLKIDNSKTIDWKSGKLQVVYTDQSNKASVLAEQIIQLK